MTKLSSLSVFFPCFNEADNIPLFVADALIVLPKLAKKFEIIIINDGSRDKTAKITSNLAKKHKFIKVIHHQENNGYGAALRTGFTAAKFDWIFFTDGDLQFQLEELKKFIPETSKFSVIIGYREKRAEGGLRVINAKLFKIYIDILFRLNVKDIDCAFKLIEAKTIKALELESTGAFINAEFLYKLKKSGKVFKQVPVKHLLRKHGQPTGNNPQVALKAGWEAFKLYSHMKWQFLTNFTLKS